MSVFCSIIEAANDQRLGYASSIGYFRDGRYSVPELPSILRSIFQHANGTPHEISEQRFMDFIPGHRLMLATEIPSLRQRLCDFYGRDEMFNVQSRTPFLTNYSNDYYLTDDQDNGVYYLDHVEGSYLLSRNMGTFLNTVLECYRRGAYFVDTAGFLEVDSDLELQIEEELNPDVIRD